MIIREDTKSNASSDIDYDQLMAQGTVIVIKDEDKKRKYMQSINKNKQNTDPENSFHSLSNTEVRGNIIIIRDKEHSLKKKSNNKITNYDDD